ncbi:MAG: transcription termination factor NusA [Candidatus Hydrogenedentota bacterium]
MDKNLRVILQQLEAEKNVNRETLIEAIRSAIESAARKTMGDVAEVMVDVDPEKLEFKVFEVREVVDEITDHTSQITLEEGKALNPNAEIGNRLKVETAPQDFGRIAAQTAKQVIIQKIKDAERDNIYDEFKQREGEMVTGTVKRYSQGNVVVIVDKAEAVIPAREQAVRESFRPNDRVRAILIQVEKGTRGTQIILSRSTPELVRALFEMEVPEIFDDTIEIKAIAREAGSRTKVAVQSNDPNVDAVGACVGMKGSRVRTVVEELSGEKIDIVRWSDNPIELCGHALNPADIVDITLDEEAKTVSVTVPHDQLSLAIGKKGQNARLASRLIGWNIDIISDGNIPPEVVSEVAEEVSDETSEAMSTKSGEAAEEVATEE